MATEAQGKARVEIPSLRTPKADANSKSWSSWARIGKLGFVLSAWVRFKPYESSLVTLVIAGHGERTNKLIGAHLLWGSWQIAARTDPISTQVALPYRSHWDSFWLRLSWHRR